MVKPRQRRSSGNLPAQRRQKQSIELIINLMSLYERLARVLCLTCTDSHIGHKIKRFGV